MLDEIKASAGAFEDIQAAPGVEGIVHLKLPFQIFEIVGKPQPIAYGNSLKPRGQWILIQSIGVRSIDHLGHAQQSRVGETKFPNDHIEGAQIAFMMKLGSRVVEGDRSFLCGPFQHLAFRYKKYLCL